VCPRGALEELIVYFQLQTDGNENVYMEKEQGLNSHIELFIAKIWDVERDKIELPYRFSMSVVEGEDPDLYGMFPGSDLIQERLVEVLESNGVDNLQTFPAEIKHADTGELVPGYVVFSIAGSVSCADLDESDHMPIGNSYYFKKLVIDPSRVHGHLMFRVEESPMVVLVHEKVAKAIMAAEFQGLVLEPIAMSGDDS
jgi:hypothetical protein